LNEPITTVAILPGDHPLVTTETIERLVRAHEQAGTVITMATVTVPNYDGKNKIFYGYGRVLRSEDGGVRAIRELKDASDDERRIRELNCGYYCFKPAWLWGHIENLDNKNKACEFYLTDMVGIATAAGERVGAVQLKTTIEGMGVNTREELAIAERAEAR
jgi:bifunctional UDP-N-acetylglucosamine pyrophosphorylase/glucosamine-1-phosphate N-acetyltransferase